MAGKAQVGNVPLSGQTRTAALDHALWGQETSPGSGVYDITWLSPLDQSNLASGHGTAHVAASAPANTDLLWFDTGTEMWRFYNGSVWWPIGGVILTNKSGVALVKGDCVVIDTANAASVITTTSANNPRVPIVAEESIADDATGVFRLWGKTKINTTGTAAVGNGVHTSTTAKKAAPQTSNAIAGRFGFYLEAGTNTLVSCYLYGQPKRIKT